MKLILKRAWLLLAAGLATLAVAATGLFSGPNEPMPPVCDPVHPPIPPQHPPTTSQADDSPATQPSTRPDAPRPS